MNDEQEARTKLVQVKDIQRNPDYQIRGKLDRGTIHRYATAYKQGSELPPITVAKVGQGLLLVDGWHRLYAMASLGWNAVEVEIIETTERDALWLAASANLNHGLPLKSREYRKAFKAYIRAGQNRLPGGRLKSYRDIATDLGGHKSHGTIRNWMRRDFPRTFERMGGNEEAHGGKGLPEKEEAPTMKEAAEEYLDMAYAAIRSIKSEEERTAIADRLGKMATDIWDGKLQEPEQLDSWDHFSGSGEALVTADF